MLLFFLLWFKYSSCKKTNSVRLNPIPTDSLITRMFKFVSSKDE